MKFRKGIQFFAPPPAVIDSNITGYVNNNSGEGVNLAFSSGDSSGTISLSADGKVITFSTPNDSYQLNNNIQNNATYANGVLTLNTPIIGIYENADFTNILLSRGETKSYPLTFNSYVRWETMSKTTLDLSTLSDITDGTHTVTVKAKADGYNDSEFSNEVSYMKAIPKYNVTVIGHKVMEGASPSTVFIKADSDSVGVNNYTAYVQGDYLYSSSTKVIIGGSSTFTASKVAMLGEWRYDTYKINNGETVNFPNGTTPVIIELSEDTTIDVGVQFGE